MVGSLKGKKLHVIGHCVFFTNQVSAASDRCVGSHH